ncbi:MAG: cobalamin-dependent protein [Bacillota bacterium]|nr:cobalamin-dependent protein [Bacillota bacterium]
MQGKLVTLLSDLKESEAIDYVNEALSKGDDPTKLLEEAKEGMTVIGNRFSKGEYFIPDLIYSGEIMKNIVGLLEPKLKEARGSEEQDLGKVIIATVEGDIHDIGKNLVVFMLDASGFNVYDLGVDVPVQDIVAKIKETSAPVVGLSGFLTLAHESMKKTVDAIESAGLRDKVKVMIGGGQIDDMVKDHIGADAYGLDATDAVKLAKQWIGG